MSATFQEAHELFNLNLRHRWFAADSQDAEEWIGPFKTIDEAAFALVKDEPEGRIFIAQGRRTKKWEREEWGVDYLWQVESQDAFEIIHKYNVNQPKIT